MRITLLLALAACNPPDETGTAPRPGSPDVDLVFEAAPHTLTLASGAPVDVYAYEGQIPGPLIRVRQGDRVRVELRNELPGLDTTIHWHGIEGTNASDGSPTTQAHVHPGESFVYDFVVPRPGTYWYHPHARGALTVMGGLYGALVVEDPDEQRLISMGVLPSREEVLVLSDLAVDEDGQLLDPETVDLLEEMNGTEGQHLLVNGVERPAFEVPEGGGVRLRMVNTSITRFYRLSLPGHTLLRVGGQGGLLDRVVVEGGTVTGEAVDEDGVSLGSEPVDLGYARGEIVLSPGERADVVVVPDGVAGDVLTMRWEDVARGRHEMWVEGGEMLMDDADDDGTRPGVDLFDLRIVEGEGATYTLAEGDPILEAVGRSVEVLADTELDWTGEQRTELFDWMEMYNDDSGHHMVNHFLIDGVAWDMESADANVHDGDVPFAPNARFASLGDTILWEVHNASHMAHPFHLHGFSYQPVRFVKHVHDGLPRTITWEVPYAEWQDTSLLPAETSIVFRVALEDVNGDGGALGRWMKHCHILQHAEGGMMSELVVE